MATHLTSSGRTDSTGEQPGPGLNVRSQAMSDEPVGDVRQGGNPVGNGNARIGDSDNGSASRHRWSVTMPTLAAIGQWLEGPPIPEQLVIRHYPWWPFEHIEQAWIRITHSVAWKDPIEVLASGTSEIQPARPWVSQTAEPHGGALQSLRERGRAKAKAGIRNVKEGLPTWIRPAPKERISQIELSPGRAMRSDQGVGSSTLTEQSNGAASQDEGLRRRNHLAGYEAVTPDATNHLNEHSFPLGRSNDTAGTAVSNTEDLSTNSDKATDIVLPIAGAHHTLPHSNRLEQSRAGIIAHQDDRDSHPDDFVESVKRDLKVNWLHWLLLFVTCACWIIAFAVLAKSIWYQSSVLSTSEDGSTTNELAASFYGCTSTYWLGNADCGLDGKNCAPFYADTPAAFRCPQGCLGTKLGSPRAVGNLLPKWTPLVVGGGDANATYRGDSWVCAAAVHAGIIDDRKGGCGTLTLTGTFSGYSGMRKNGVDSIDFNSTFPVSYRFGGNATAAQCTDRRGQLYILDVIMSAFVGFVLRPKPIVCWILVCLGYWHVNFASEPRDYPPPVGAAFGDFLPTLFGCYVIWRVAFRFVWPHFQHVPLEREIWTLAAFWVGVLLNVVFADVPLNRLVASDIASQPGALTALIILIIVVVVLASNQVRVIRKTTLLPRYLSIYITGAVIVGLLAAIPGESLRLHHYIIALVLLPGCAFPTRLSLIYCAFLLGMFENGVGRWGFDGLIQDVATVIGDGVSGTGLPTFLNSSINWAGFDGVNASANGLVAWAPLNTSDPDQQGFDSFNLLVDDVLRYSGSGTTFNLSSLLEDFTELADPSDSNSTALNDAIRRQPHYLRLAFASGSGSTPGDFTRAAIAYSNGTFVDAPPGAT
ncbi:hypothetical protein OC845_003662 [Tilletia horrida]|nr:hypothetical protein OC845_003662 [Tilletia horrida]